MEDTSPLQETLLANDTATCEGKIRSSRKIGFIFNLSKNARNKGKQQDKIIKTRLGPNS